MSRVLNRPRRHHRGAGDKERRARARVDKGQKDTRHVTCVLYQDLDLWYCSAIIIVGFSHEVKQTRDFTPSAALKS